MLTSLVLSMAMSATPAPVIENNTLETQEISRSKRQLRIQDKLDINEISRSKRQLRINAKSLEVTEVSRSKRQLRI